MDAYSTVRKGEKKENEKKSEWITIVKRKRLV